MEIVGASINWDGPRRNVLRLFAEPTPLAWITDPIDDAIAVFVGLDEDEKETGEIAGVEIVGFLDFDRWDDIPELPLLWQLPGWPPLPLVTLLQRLQPALRREAESAVASPAATS